MASLPHGALILTREEAQRFFPQWSANDRRLAREAIDEVGVKEFYVPPSGGYVAGHGGGEYGMRPDVPVNGLVMHVGFLHLLPNLAEWGMDERRPLSKQRESPGSGGGARGHVEEEHPQLCPKCHCALPVHGDCDFCN
jgi:hypothetical protein